MQTLVLNPSSLSQWRALIVDAGQASSIKLSEDLESYLVFLLMRFIKNPEIVDTIMALDYLQNIQRTSRENQQTLRDVGDKCLLFAGLFPKSAGRRQLRISYYVKLGQMAYASLSGVHQNQLSELFKKLGSNFVGLMDVLQAVRALDPNASVLDLLEAEELWAETKSTYALKILRQSTKGFLIPSAKDLLQKH